MTIRPVALISCLALASPTLAQIQPERWRVTRDLQIGSLDDPRGALTAVHGLTIDNRGRMYVVQQMERSIKVFDRNGRYAGEVGRSGRGPGEFSVPSGVGWRNDTLWISDLALQRVSFFTSNGDFLTSIQLPAWSNGRVRWSIRTATPLTDGSLLGRPNAAPIQIANGEVSALPLLRIHPRGMRFDVLAWLSTRNEVFYAQVGPDRVLMGPQIVSDAPLWEASPDGKSIVLVHRGVSSGDEDGRFRVMRLRPDGTTLFNKAYRYSPARFPERFGDSLVARYLRGKDRLLPSSSAAARGVRKAMYLPRYKPPVTQLVIGRDETIWLRREEPTGRSGTATWNVLDGNGHVIASIEIPQTTRVLAAERDYVWGVEQDELDVPLIVRYRVHRPGPR